METMMAATGQKVLETELDQFLKAIVHAMDKAVQYTEILNQMQKRVTDMTLLVKQIEELNYTLGCGGEEVNELVSILRNGEALVKKCAEGMRWWNFWFKRPSYS